MHEQVGDEQVTKKKSQLPPDPLIQNLQIVSTDMAERERPWEQSLNVSYRPSGPGAQT